MRLLVLALVAMSLAGCFQDDGIEDGVPSDDSGETPADARLERVLGGLDSPLLVTHDGQDRYIVEQEGRVLRWIGDQATLWLDIRDRVQSGGERGLLGLAFPPDHAASGRFYVSYTDEDGTSILSRFLVEGGEPDADSEQVLLSVQQPFSNHNGGHIEFGPDGYLYMGLGDGGFRDDPQQNGQNKGTLLGTILRLDVSGDDYKVPSDNPFVSETGSRGEIWHYGLRNPWRFHFDSDGGLWIGDVGQDAWEEVDHAAPGASGLNFGWPAYEGNHLHAGGPALDPIFPVAEYANGDDGCSITGGPVYEGSVEDLQGLYLFADYCTGTIWSMVPGSATYTIWQETDLRISSFGQDADGEVYVVDHQGAIHQILQ